MQSLAELYVIDGQYEKAFSLYADVSVSVACCPLDIQNHLSNCTFDN